MPSLIVERGQEKGFSFGLTSGATSVIGRDPESEIIISDPAASRRHVQIRSDGDAWFAEDLGSSNSTYVNEQQITEETPLEYGDRIQVGETIFSFLEEEKTAEGKAAGLTGQDIGGYKILERVGRGGMGTVYRARQVSVNRIVALKILSDKYVSNPEFVEQFVAEARSAGQLNHPNVVQVFDVGQMGKLNFFSMEYMDSGSVQDMLPKREGSRLPWTEALPIVQDAARGLVFAEKRGIIHRDIKPDNLMLSSEGKAKIGDLGLAMRSDAARKGPIIGTAHFIAPEQARGLDIGHTADIYSLGASFYRICAGMTPFQGATVKEILRKQVNDPHVPLCDFVEDFPPDLSAIVDKMMSKSVEGRYQSASELLEDLDKFYLDHQIELAGGIQKSNKPLLIGGGLTIAALGIVAVLFANQAPDVIERNNTKIVEVKVGAEGPVLTPEAMRKQKLLAAKSDLFELRLANPTGEVDLARKDAWLEKAGKYVALAKKHPEGGEHTLAAKDLAREIKKTLRDSEDLYEATVGAATKWWNGEKARIDANLASGNWSAVLRDARRLPNDVVAQKHLEHVPEAATILAGLEADVVKRAKASFDAAQAEAKRLMGAGDADDLGAAFAYMSGWGEEMRKHADADPEFAALAQSAADWVLAQQDGLLAELDGSRAADRALFANAYRAARHVAEGDADPTSIDLEFAAAAAKLEATRDALATWIYQDRLDDKVTRLRDMQSSWKAFVGKVAAGEVLSAEDRLVGITKPIKGRESIATLNLDKRITLKGFKVKITIPGMGSDASTVSWAELTREQIWDNFFAKHLDKYTPDESLGLAAVFAELGHAAGADALLQRAIEGGALETRPETKTALEREIASSQALAAARAGPPGELPQALDAWRKEHYRSDFFVLADKRPVEQLPDLFTPTELAEFTKSFGKRKP